MICLPFFHKYKIVKARKTYGMYLGYRLTVLSSVCKKCNKTKLETITGHFDIEDFTQERSK